MEAQYKIDGTLIKRPSDFKIERYKVTNLERLANAEMCGDLIAKKRKFLFKYESISSTDLDKILDILWETDEVFFTLTYVENNVEKTARVYPGAIPSDLHRTGGKWVWKNVTFNLIEK